MYTVPFLIDPARALRDTGVCRADIAETCSGLVACFVLGVAGRVCGDPAASLAASVLPRIRVPGDSAVLSLWWPARSAAQDSVAAGCSLMDGVCVHDLSAPGVAEADALASLA